MIFPPSRTLSFLSKMMFPLLTSLLFMLLNSNNYYGCCASTTKEVVTCSNIVPLTQRAHNISITDFGGVGDGNTINTKAFKDAISKIQETAKKGGTLLYVPAGVYRTGPFNLTSSMTLYLASGAVIKASQESSTWPLIAPLPSYGRGRENPGGRYISFIHGDGLQDVIITGENGIIDGQGEVWWHMHRHKTLKYTRPGLIELMNSKNIIISNVVLKNSPFWNIHPVYCSNVVVRFVTILAPHESPNTDGVDPENVLAEHINLNNIKTNIGRGGYIKNITVSNVYMENVKTGIRISSNALTIVKDIIVRNMKGVKVHQAGSLQGLEKSPFTNISLSDINFSGVSGSETPSWNCSKVSGIAYQVSPLPCAELINHQSGSCAN
ncbi:putative galacturan 1,4-alpha-galacturonidase [Lupinus albus]|uniref:Putative galacturan 1,4-alpha-galacturonidase n=1 Tax=Lupinus albus TaxID=3870 RepID=A0A6A4PY86_LUPAL|nr:putative galacturan 1,4-alpha-galacturonidase [Lupinus albus]